MVLLNKNLPCCTLNSTFVRQGQHIWVRYSLINKDCKLYVNFVFDLGIL